MQISLLLVSTKHQRSSSASRFSSMKLESMSARVLRLARLLTRLADRNAKYNQGENNGQAATVIEPLVAREL